MGNGRVICASVYSGPDVDFGAGPRLWVDNLDDANGLLEVFRPWFEDETAKKVWHNYSFDRHVMHNDPLRIDCRGFAGDTMHMARLWDSSRNRLSGGGGHNLTALSHDHSRCPRRVDLFGVPKLKKDDAVQAAAVAPADGRAAAGPRDAAPMDPLRGARRRGHLAAARGAERAAVGDEVGRGYNDQSMLDFFDEYIAPFGELLTDLERNGILVDTAYLAEQERRAEREQEAHMQAFLRWASEQCPDGN